MAALAYLPALASSPGRMPADTKLGLYLDPRQLVADSIWSFDARQFAGWVPHQTIAYLWPSGPWYVVADAVGLPDWVAHRLWIGTIMFAAGAGAAWAARRLGLSLAAALAAGLVYQLSPYLVPYISRTSSMLLPWAGLGWVVGLTVGAATRTRWRDAALCSLVVATTGSVNATALAMVAPAPVLWLVVSALERRVTWRRAVSAALRIGVLSVGTSLWWIVMLAIQGRQGADLLAYSESLEDVSLTATSSEVWRGLGYWLTYIRDPYAATTTAGADYLTTGRALVLGFILVVVALAGLTLTRFAARRYAIALVVVGLLLAVGVHPFAHPSPLAHVLTGDGASGLALALRSSTRALPLLTLGLGLGAAAAVDVLGRHRPTVRWVAASAVALVALGNLPLLTGSRLVDPALERDQDPPSAWLDAADALDQHDRGDDYRVMLLPGAEFGAFRWGYTVDPPLAWLADVPLVTRDLLPLGSPAAMDLLYAFDDRFQNGVIDEAAVAPVARLFGVATIWVPGDAAFERFRTPRPEVTASFFQRVIADGLGLGPAEQFGIPTVNSPRIPMVDEQALTDPDIGTPVAPVTLIDVDDPVGVVRATDDVVLLSGSGDGMIDTAGAGLIDGHEAIVYSASLGPDVLARLVAQGATTIVTDTNRDRSHHWRSSQDVTGYTEGADGSSVLWVDSGDARLDVFPEAGPGTRSVAVADGPLSARATSYGELFAYRPEARPGMAIDGDPNTAWAVLDPRNQYLEVRTDAGIDHVTLLQPNGAAPVRRLGSVTLTVDGGPPVDVDLDERSAVSGQRIDIEPTSGPTTVRIALGRTVAGADRQGRPDRTLVGLAEVDVGLGSSPEVIVTPTDLTSVLRSSGVAGPVTYVLTRERVRGTNRWRRDPEVRMVRDIDVPTDMVVVVAPTLTVRLDERASDTVLAGLLGIEGPVATTRLDGVASAGGWAVADGDDSTAWITPFEGSVGSAITVDLTDPTQPLTVTQRTGNYSRVTMLRIVQDDVSEVVAVPAPDRAGHSTIVLPAGLEPGPVRLEIDTIAVNTTTDRRYGDVTAMPIAISDITNITPTTIPSHFDTGCRSGLFSIDGQPVEVSVTGLVTDALAGDPLDVAVCSDDIELGDGTHRLSTNDDRRTGLVVDRIVLAADPVGNPTRSTAAAAADAAPAATVTRSSRLGRTVDVSNCPDGCWLVLGEGYHQSWSAHVAGSSLGPPTLIDGGFNGWRIPPSEGSVTVQLSWSAQPPLNLALAVSGVMVLLAAVLAVGDRRRDVTATIEPARHFFAGRPDGLVRTVIAAGAWTVGAGLLVSPGYAWWGALGGVALLVSQRARLAGVVAVVAMTYIAVDVITTVWREHPDPTPRFPGTFEHLHHLGLFVGVSLGVAALSCDRTGTAGRQFRRRAPAPSSPAR